MILHIVLFQPKPDLTDARRQEIFDAVTAAAAMIPSIRRVQFGKRTRHGLPGYEQAMSIDFEYALVVEFDDQRGLTDYLTHPAHAGIGVHFTESAAAALAYDYHVG